MNDYVDIKFTEKCTILFNDKMKTFSIKDVDRILGITGEGNLLVAREGKHVIIEGEAVSQNEILLVGANKSAAKIVNLGTDNTD